MISGLPGFLLDVSLRCLALGSVCGAALWLFRIRNAAVQYAVWRFALYGMLLVPAVTPVVPALRMPARFAVPVTGRFLYRNIAYPVQPKRVGAGSAARQANVFERGERKPGGRGISWQRIALLVWLVVAGVLLGRLFAGWLWMHRGASRTKRIDDARLLHSANEQCRQLGLLSFPEFRAAETVSVPVTFGSRRPVILLPEDWPEWEPEKLDFVLAHELSHIQRGDYFIRMISAINKSIYWFHPLSWWLDRRLGELSEQLSDDAALGAGVSADPEAYAAVLCSFARLAGRSGRRFQTGIAMSAPAVSRRINRILDGTRRLSTGLHLRQKLLVSGVGISVLVLVAGAQTGQRPVAPVPPAPGAPIVPASPMAVPRQHRAPLPMFSSAYVAALRDVLELEPGDVAALEERLAKDPDDFAARMKLIAYSMRADRAGLAESREQRSELVLWLVEHRPDSEILGSPYAVFSGSELTPDQEARAMQLWSAATRDSASDSRVFWNAANFYQQTDRSLFLKSLEQAVVLAPANENYAQRLGLLYAEGILAGAVDPEFARHASTVLDGTANPFLVEAAVKLLQSEYNKSLMTGKPETNVGDLAKRYFEKAKALDPDLDAEWIYPAIRPDMVGMMASGAPPPTAITPDVQTAAAQLRRLPPDAFPNLPPGVAGVLRGRSCLVPQPSAAGPAVNVIAGEFFRKGETGWAVLCSTNGSSSILVFRSGSDNQPEELAKAEDANYLQSDADGRWLYSREIRPVDRKFIMDHYRAYGGPEPPPIDHQGIDDAFLEKASVSYYWYRGEWRTLTGSD